MKQNTQFAELLMMWFEENKREMPWRKTKEPYKIWVSEVMLQQTQVATVIPYYLRFLERFPTVEDLANATLEEVHTYWQGLGYYRRGENLWKGAKVVMELFGGQFPKEPKLIKQIPGIGPYTLGAISSICYNLPLPAVDGNVMRVMSRWYRIADDISNAKSKKVFEEKVMENMPPNAGDFNQALMELGAMICTPKNPQCSCCPVQTLCEAYKHDVVENYPVKIKKLQKVEEEYRVLIIIKEDTLGMIKRSEEGLLANMWGLPMYTKEEWESHNFEEIKYKTLSPVKHIFTHKKWIMEPCVMRWNETLEAILKERYADEIQYIKLRNIKDIPVATAFYKVIDAASDFLSHYTPNE